MNATEEQQDEVRESRQIMRQVQDHLFSAHTNLGALREIVGLVEVLHHPTSGLADLNYVTPRRNTAWVSARMIEQGLDYLRGLDRQPRVQYIEGLFPPPFAKTLRSLGLMAEWEMPMMVYKVDLQKALPRPSLPDGVVIETVKDLRGIELWWYVWRNAFYDVLTLGVEPLFVGRDMAALKMGIQVDILAYRYGFPVGVARVSIQKQTANILALAILKEARTPELTRALTLAAMRAAIERKCLLIFAPGESEAERALCRELGFMDFGSVVCYAAQPGQTHEDVNERSLPLPVLTLR